MARASTWLPVAVASNDSATRNNLRRFYLGWERNIALLEDLDWLTRSGESTNRIVERLGFCSWRSLWDHLHDIPADGTQLELGAEAARLRRLLTERRRNEDTDLSNWNRKQIKTMAS